MRGGVWGSQRLPPMASNSIASTSMFLPALSWRSTPTAFPHKGLPCSIPKPTPFGQFYSPLGPSCDARPFMLHEPSTHASCCQYYMWQNTRKIIKTEIPSHVEQNYQLTSNPEEIHIFHVCLRPQSQGIYDFLEFREIWKKLSICVCMYIYIYIKSEN